MDEIRHENAFLTNIILPNNPSAMGADLRLLGQTRQEAQAEQQAWLADKVIGDPQPTATISVAELKEMGYVGVYLEDKFPS